MLPFLKKKQEESVRSPQEAAAHRRDVHDYIPYYNHFNPHTLLTKNGEVLQVIRISCNNKGLNYESGENDTQTLREHIRAALTKRMTSTHFSAWIHIIRRKKDVHYKDHFSGTFTSYMHDLWHKRHAWKYQYYNEIYITVLREGQGVALLDQKSLGKAILPHLNRNYRNTFLDKAAEELENVIDGMLQDIGVHYRAERLSIVERAPEPGKAAIFHSEPVEFLATLYNLRATPFPVSACDVSKQTSPRDLIFGFNAIEAKGWDNRRRFGAILSLKQYREVTPEGADHLLQASVELIISQSISFTPAKKALKDYKIQKELFHMSGDSYSLKASGLEEMLTGNHGAPTDFVETQTTILMLTDDAKKLDGEVQKAQEAFGKMGLLTVREDIKLEECFWSQLPGNFEFIRRRNILRFDRCAGFCRLNLFPDGYNRGVHWGEALSLIPTTVNSPYFFNFHVRDNGHTIAYDFNSFKDPAGNTLINFLLASATKFNGRIYIFDRNQSTYLMTDKLDGRYHTFASAKRKSSSTMLQTNPFSLEDTKRNRAFLSAWCHLLLEPYFSLEDSHHRLISACIDTLYAMPVSDRNLHTLIDLVAAEDYHLSSAFLRFAHRGECAGLFDATHEMLDINTALHAFNMDALIKDSHSAVPMFAYLLHRIISALDGKPTIIVLHEVWDLLENAFFTPRIESLLEMLTQNNAMLLCTTQRPDLAQNKSTFQLLMRECATQLYIPDDINADYRSMIPSLAERDVQLLKRMDRQKGSFLVVQNQESIALSIDLYHMDDVKAIFANDIKTLIAAGGKFASLPDMYQYAQDFS